ncbi:hypothetical protein [Azospirillum sp. TSO22-1]|uniref:hypothetical protein n=1 Tax=Azospirillum sp. TSO22-1 TaxID=716789 RepID=UPI0011B840B2|nr:hypothetical protein [Azospirillum sp. TSO22-1]
MTQTTATRAATRLGWTLAGAMLAAGCASSGPTDNPVARRMSWISYVSGDDLRTSCRSDGPERYRLVFNADYNQHVRTYDLTADPADGGAVLEARVIQATDLARMDASDPLANLRGAKAQTKLTAPQFAAFIASLTESGAFDGVPDRLRLRSNGIYWLVNGCHGGRWFFSAYPYPDHRFVDVRFADPLAALDGTGVPFPALPAPGTRSDRPRDDPGADFQIDVDANGVIGPTRLFGPWTLAGR